MQSDVLTLRDLFKRDRIHSTLSAFALLIIAYLVEHYVNLYIFEYSQRPTSRYVGDIILDNLPPVDLTFIIIEVAFVAIVLVTLFVLSKPRYTLFTVKAVTLFIIIRALFVSLTHVGIHPEVITPGLGFFDSIYLFLNLQTGLFFSGHVGMPFLMALIFWDMVYVRHAFLFLSFIFAVAVLFAHSHYSIDVFAAPFMAYGIYNIARHLFKSDYELIPTNSHLPRP